MVFENHFRGEIIASYTDRERIAVIRKDSEPRNGCDECSSTDKIYLRLVKGEPGSPMIKGFILCKNCAAEMIRFLKNGSEGKLYNQNNYLIELCPVCEEDHGEADDTTLFKWRKKRLCHGKCKYEMIHRIEEVYNEGFSSVFEDTL